MLGTVAMATAISLVFFVIYKLKLAPNRRSPPKIFAFFHPYASGGGGGERVLWKMIQFLQQQNMSNLDATTTSVVTDPRSDDNMEIVIFTVDPPSTNEQDLRRDAQQRFDVSIPRPIRLVSLEEHKESCLRPRPFLSLVMESLGTMRLAKHALQKMPKSPDVFCDTTGCAFTFAVVRWMCPSTWILAYVHYPTISTDMMLWEWKNKESSAVEKNGQAGSLRTSRLIRRIKTIVKLVYYWFFAICYGLVGSLADLVMVNSTWTYNHISSLWRFSSHPIEIVYPPCRVPETIGTQTSTMTSPKQRKRTIVSIGQFRPEKNHALQLQALAVLLERHPELKTAPSRGSENDDPRIQLELIGSCRNEPDKGRLQELRQLVIQLGIQDHVVFNVNPPYHELQAAMTDASMGIHTMRQEHFGIGIVEMMAAGLLVIANDSGGPKTDIIDPGVSGFLATTAEEYANAIFQAMTLDNQAQTDMRRMAQESASRFSDSEFDKNLALALDKIPLF